MKKILFLIALLVGSISANAQLVTSTSRKVTTQKTPSNLLWIARAGVNFASMSGDFAWTGNGLKSKVGYFAGIEFQSPITADGLYWGAGLALKSKGAKYNEKYYEEKIDMKFNANALEIPVNIGYKFDLGNDFKIAPHAGLFVNYDLWGKMTEKYSYSGETEKEEYNLSEIEDYDDGVHYNRFSAGVAFGVGAWYRNFNIDLNFQFGFTNVFKFDSDYYYDYGDKGGKNKEQYITLTLGYAF